MSSIALSASPSPPLCRLSYSCSIDCNRSWPLLRLFLGPLPSCLTVDSITLEKHSVSYAMAKVGKKAVPPKSFEQAIKREKANQPTGAAQETIRLGTAKQSMGITVGRKRKAQSQKPMKPSGKRNPGKAAMGAAKAKANRAVRKKIPKGMNVAGLTAQY